MKDKLGEVVFWAVILAAAIATLGQAMTEPLGKDEHMYVAAGVYSLDLAMYSDFAYLQMPYLPRLYALLFSAVGGTHYLLLARLVSWALGVALISSVTIGVRALSGSRLLGAAAAVLLIMNPITATVLPLAWNAFAPLAVAVPAVLLLWAAFRATRTWTISALLATSGLLAGVAVGLKLTAAFVPAALAIGVLVGFRYLRPGQVLTRLCILLFGVGVGLTPALVDACRGPGPFAFNNLKYHQLKAQRSVADDTVNRVHGWSRNFGEVRNIAREPGNVCLLLLVAMAGVGVVRLPGLRGASPDVVVAWWSALAAAALACVFALLPSPMWLHGWILPIPFALLVVGVGASRLPAGDRAMFEQVTIIAAAICLVIGPLGTYLKGTLRLAKPSQWTPLVVHEQGQRLAAELGSLPSPARVATLHPLLALEGGLGVYPEFSTGPHMYYVAGLLSAEEQRAYVTTSPDGLAGLLDKTPPDAILVVDDPIDTEQAEMLQRPFVEYATSHGYVPRRDIIRDGTVYVR